MTSTKLCSLRIESGIVTEDFRAEKRNKHARVLAACQSPKFEKMAGILLIL